MKQLIKLEELPKKEGMLYGKDALIAYPWDEYSLENNCGEVWSAREAIIHGVRFNDLQFVSIFRESGKIREMCKNCTVTFKNKTAL